MIACNRHGHPPLDPDRRQILLDLPEPYLDLMFADAPNDEVDDTVTEPEPLVA